MAVRPTRRRARGLLAAGAGLLIAAVPVSGAAALPAAAPAALPSASAFSDGTYVVTLAADPIAKYDGTLPGLPQLKAAPGGGLDVTQAAAEKYRSFLLNAQSVVAKAVDATPLQRYTVALNGFSAQLTAEQAAKLAGTAGVLAVTKDTLRHPDAVAATTGAAAVGKGTAATTADYLGLTGPGGVWDQLGGVDAAGDGVVVADLDTGLWPEHPSVAGAPLPRTADPADPYLPHRSGGTITMDKSDGGTFTGVCETGTGWTAANCTTKVVGARAFSAGYRTSGPLAATEYPSARDSDGHGTHTGTTAVGLSGIDASVRGVDYGDITGIAPAAALAVYKVCWTGADGDAGCATSDLVAAIDAAVADNVDVINFSIGGGAATNVVDPVELAFLSAASAGIFVSASAGNSGPDASTLDHASPWLTTVAAGTSALREGTVVLGNGKKYAGTRLEQSALASKPLVLASSVAAAGKTAADAQNCLAGTLDPAKAKGKVIICDRAITARIAKSQEVARVGGAGLVLVNIIANGTEADAHTVPTVHLDLAAGKAVKAYAAANPRATVSFAAGNTTGTATATPQISGFSSRGPTFVNDGDVLKPDITAPGSAILAGYSPEAETGTGDLFAPSSGTSMSAPHVTGLAALYFTAHPDWSPMAVKSALMTTATSLKRADGKDNRNPFDGGAGFVNPTKMFEPGLVYDSGARDWLAYLAGSLVDTGTGIPAIDPSNLNQASIAIGGLVGTQTVTRSVTATTPGLYYATGSVPGVDVKVSPSVLTFGAAGETKQFRVTFTRTTATLDTWATGALTWKGADLTVRSPVAVKPLALSAPAQVTGSGAQGSVDVTITSGTTGDLEVTPAGLAEGTSAPGALPVGAKREFPVVVPEGGGIARFDVDAGLATSDLDLFLYQVGSGGARELVGQSATGSADEKIDLVADPGEYVAVVEAYSAAPGQREVGFTFTSYVVTGAETAGNLTVTPDPVPTVQSRDATFSVSWSGLDPAKDYLGVLLYEDSPSPTFVSIT